MLIVIVTDTQWIFRCNDDCNSCYRLYLSAAVSICDYRGEREDGSVENTDTFLSFNDGENVDAECHVTTRIFVRIMMVI